MVGSGRGEDGREGREGRKIRGKVKDGRRYQLSFDVISYC